MKCPRDGTPLENFERSKQQLDRCPTCDGLWCDASELARLAATSQDLPHAEVLDGFTAPCPRCNQSLTRRYYNRERTVVVDFCSSCQGVWLDEDELKQVILVAHGLV